MKYRYLTLILLLTLATLTGCYQSAHEGTKPITNLCLCTGDICPPCAPPQEEDKGQPPQTFNSKRGNTR